MIEINPSEYAEYIPKAGACVVSKNILEGRSKLKWLFREESIDRLDNGWRFFSGIDDDDFVNSIENLVVCDFNTVANIEPAIIGIYPFPVGSDLQLVKVDGRITFFDNYTGEEVKIPY